MVHISSIDCDTMTSKEKVMLKWNAFQENFNVSVSSLRRSSEFSDVTLACEDGQHMEAHKLILASSPFFQNIFRKTKHAHPLIYMRGVKSEDLLAILDFLYYGEASIFQENLTSFLNIAEELNIKGLIQGDEEYAEELQMKKDKTIEMKLSPVKKSDNESQNIIIHDPSPFSQPYYQANNLCSEVVAALSRHKFTGNMQELDKSIEAMIERGEKIVKKGSSMIRAHVCKVCGKECIGRNIKEHIEANHIEGITIPCNTCGKIFRSRSSLRSHNNNYHIQIY